MNHSKKILVTVDASPHSLEAVHYAGEFFSPENTEIQLFHVDTHIPESFWDMNLGSGFQRRMASVKSWTLETQRAMKEQMENARMILLDQGFPYKAVTIKQKDSVKGVARDIIDESKQGFDAVVAGRTGISRVKDLLMGNIATKLVGKIVGIPLIIVGAYTNPRKVLIAFDGSEGSTRAVECIGTMMVKDASSVKICYVIRTISDLYRSAPADIKVVEEDMFKKTRGVVEPLIENALETLVASGFKPENVSHEIKQNEYSRARAVVEDATSNRYGTIVVGRRGLSRVEEFFIGRVSKKVLQLGLNSAVWIVN
ncbi:MAG: universal stress protein [Desulfobacteraceae bacterium]|nr:universal stress protein [Desulfobacteraceae bacterium]